MISLAGNPRGKRKENDGEKEGDKTRGSSIASRTPRINDEEAEACSDDVSRFISCNTKRFVILDNV